MRNLPGECHSVSEEITNSLSIDRVGRLPNEHQMRIKRRHCVRQHQLILPRLDPPNAQNVWLLYLPFSGVTPDIRTTSWPAKRVWRGISHNETRIGGHSD